MFKSQLKLLRGRAKKFAERVADAVTGDSIELNATYRFCKDPVQFVDRLAGEYKPIKEGEIWGHNWENAWFHLTGNVPAAWAGKVVVTDIDICGEGLIFNGEGTALYSLSSGSIFHKNCERRLFPVIQCAKGGESIDLWVDASASHLFGLNRKQDPDDKCPDRYGTVTATASTMRLSTYRSEVFQLLMDLEVLLSLLENKEDGSAYAGRIIRSINNAISAYAENPDNATLARAQLKEMLDLQADATALTSIAVGHAHIDTGWLWPVRETIRKCGRTFAAQVSLIERYPGYVFGASQPQHYAFTKQYYPSIYEKIKEKVKEGSWELQGGMWVEADCNVTSGESLVRQILHGKNFYMDEFGEDVKNLWIPDVFGYSAAMPQILKKSGIDYFLTQKISWSQFNKFPHHTFKWRGIDGSEVITHFPPEDTYNSELRPHGQIKAENQFAENHILDEFMCLFGIGDGGGGPRENHIEYGLRQQNLAGTPKVKFGTAKDFFDRLKNKKDLLQTWVGELYLELHRATLTTQALVKKMNRKMELRLREIEYLCTMMPSDRYPKETLDKLWKTLLINQFHDILPGSSITEVYQVTHAEHAQMAKTLNEIEADAVKCLMIDDDTALTLINTLSVPYRGTITLPEGWSGCSASSGSGELDAVQVENGNAVALLKIDPNATLQLKKADAATQAPAPSELVLENDLIRYEFSEDGTITRAIDKTANCEVLAGKGNLFNLYEDRPCNWDAWDIDIYYPDQFAENARTIKAEALCQGPARSALKFSLAIGSKSEITQVVTLDANSKRLDFATTVDWQEKHRMLRVAFETAIQTEKATFDIQYGYAERATHDSTTWDMAKFEVVAHKYADLSDRNYGVALLNDCKYGYKVKENILDLNLLRSSTYPDPDADQGKHEFVYSLLPHEGTLQESDVIAESMCLNQGILTFAGKTFSAKAPAVLDAADISLEVVKRAEKNDDIILRLVETGGKVSKGTLKLAESSKFVETDLMEWNNVSQINTGDSIGLVMKPFEIRTYRIMK